MNDLVNVVVSQLRTHAGSLDDCVAIIEEARGASSHIRLGDDAYGLLCSWIPPFIEDNQDQWDELASMVEGNLSTGATLLRGAADGFEETDSLNAGNVDTSSTGLTDSTSEIN